jgi:hypothetical protein
MSPSDRWCVKEDVERRHGDGRRIQIARVSTTAVLDGSSGYPRLEHRKRFTPALAGRGTDGSKCNQRAHGCALGGKADEKDACP